MVSCYSNRHSTAGAVERGKGIENIEIHLLELKDIFEKNENFIKACAVLPELIYLDDRSKI
jgi:hypothetical protein